MFVLIFFNFLHKKAPRFIQPRGLLFFLHHYSFTACTACRQPRDLSQALRFLLPAEATHQPGTEPTRSTRPTNYRQLPRPTTDTRSFPHARANTHNAPPERTRPANHTHTPSKPRPPERPTATSKQGPHAQLTSNRHLPTSAISRTPSNGLTPNLPADVQPYC